LEEINFVYGLLFIRFYDEGLLSFVFAMKFSGIKLQ